MRLPAFLLGIASGIAALAFAVTVAAQDIQVPAPSVSAGGGITALTGDVTASGGGSQPATVNGVAGATSIIRGSAGLFMSGANSVDNESTIEASGTNAGSGTVDKGVFVGTTFAGANSANVFAFNANFHVGNVGVNLSNVDAFFAGGLTLDATYVNSTPAINVFEANPSTDNRAGGPYAFLSYSDFLVDPMTLNDGITSGTGHNRGLFVSNTTGILVCGASGHWACAGSGGTLTNELVSLDMPDGTGSAGTTNCAICITGNGQPSSINWGIKSTSSADSKLTGGLDFTPIGAVSASTGAFTTLSATGALTYGGITLANAVTGTGSMVLSVSPALTGSPTAPTQTTSDNSTDIATDAFVKAQGYGTGSVASVACPSATITATGSCNPLTTTGTANDAITATGSANGIQDAGYGFVGTAAKVYTFPTTTATIARTDAAQTFTGLQTFGAITASTAKADFAGVGSAPTGSGSCAINTQVGGNQVGNFKLNGTCTGGTVILTFATTQSSGYACFINDETTSADTFKQTAHSTTTATFTGTGVSADVISFGCTGY